MKILVTAALAASLAGPVTAEPQCLPRMDALTSLMDRFGEQRRVVAMAADSTILVEVWGNELTGTWTVTGTTANGIMCIVMAGDGFEALAALPEGDPA